MPQIERDVLASLKEPTHDSRQVVERLQAKGYTLNAGKDPGKIQYPEHSESGLKLDVQQIKFGGQPITDGIVSAMERTRQEKQKKEQKQSHNRSRGMRM